MKEPGLALMLDKYMFQYHLLLKLSLLDGQTRQNLSVSRKQSQHLASFLSLIGS